MRCSLYVDWTLSAVKGQCLCSCIFPSSRIKVVPDRHLDPNFSLQSQPNTERTRDRMPTQTEFLSNSGLVPQTTSADCMICHDQAVSPVTTSGCECRVTYCRQCILDWYTRGSNKCPTCRVEVYSLDTSDSDSESESDVSDDEDIEDGAPRFGLDVTIANVEGDEMIYLLRDNPWDLDDDEAVEAIRTFRSSSIDAEMPIDERSHRPACVKAYLLVDYLLADANVFYEEQLETALESCQATEEDFCSMIKELGIMIERYDGDTMSYEELYDNLLMSVLGQLSSMSGVFLGMWNARRNNQEIDLDPIQRYLQDIVEELAEEGERIYYRLNWNEL